MAEDDGMNHNPHFFKIHTKCKEKSLFRWQRHNFEMSELPYKILIKIPVKIQFGLYLNLRHFSHQYFDLAINFIHVFISKFNRLGDSDPE